MSVFCIGDKVQLGGFRGSGIIVHFMSLDGGDLEVAVVDVNGNNLLASLHEMTVVA